VPLSTASPLADLDEVASARPPESSRVRLRSLPCLARSGSGVALIDRTLGPVAQARFGGPDGLGLERSLRVGVRVVVTGFVAAVNAIVALVGPSSGVVAAAALATAPNQPQVFVVAADGQHLRQVTSGSVSHRPEPYRMAVRKSSQMPTPTRTRATCCGYLEPIKLLLGRTLIERWEMWRPAIRQARGPLVSPMFETLDKAEVCAGRSRRCCARLIASR
jgi:hypothetical protein